MLSLRADATSRVQQDLYRLQHDQCARLFAVDAPNFLHRLLAPINHRVVLGGEDPKRFLPELAVERALDFVHRTAHAVPVFVLEGPSPKSKAATQARRRADREAAATRARTLATLAQEARESERAGLVEQARRAASGAVDLTRDDEAYIGKRLKEAGFPVVRAPGEAEAQAAYWARHGHVWTVATRDMDAILYGAPRVSVGWPESRGWRLQRDFLQRTGARSWTQLMEAFVLSGQTDHAPRVDGVLGVEHAVSLLRSMSFELILQAYGADPTTFLAARETYVHPLAEPTLNLAA